MTGAIIMYVLALVPAWILFEGEELSYKERAMYTATWPLISLGFFWRLGVWVWEAADEVSQ